MKRLIFLFGSIWISTASYAYDEATTQKMYQVLDVLNQEISKVGGELAKPAPNLKITHHAVATQVNKYKIMKNNGASLRDLCLQSVVIKEVLLNIGHEAGYREWNKVASYNCLMAESNPGL